MKNFTANGEITFALLTRDSEDSTLMTILYWAYGSAAIREWVTAADDSDYFIRFPQILVRISAITGETTILGTKAAVESFVSSTD